jgi:hypothetical protein
VTTGKNYKRVGVVICFVVVLIYVCLEFVARQARNAVIWAFLDDVAVFALQNGRALPNDWDQFNHWSVKRGNQRWVKDTIEDNFELNWGASVAESPSDKWLIRKKGEKVKDPDYWSGYLWRRIYASKNAGDSGKPAEK